MRLNAFLTWRLLWSVALLCGCAARPCADPAARTRVLVVKTRDNAFYNPVVDGITSGLKTRGWKVGDKIDLVVIALTGKDNGDTQQVRTQIAKHPQLIFAIGTDAACLLLKEKPDIPVLFSMVLDPVALGLVKTLDAPGDGFSGTTLLVSPGKQLDALLQTVPSVHRVGLCYTEGDATSLAFLIEARRDAERLHLEIAARPVKTTATPADFDALGQLDALWLIPDPASTGPEAAKSTLAYALAHKLPTLGASGATVRAGAILALSANLSDLGDLTADMAARVLDGTETVAKMRVRGPRLTLLSVNLQAAHALNLNLPDALLHLADEVIEAHKDGE